MANMFSKFLHKQIPKTFIECYTNDEITNNLWQWAKNLEIIGKVFAIISGIATFIAGIAMLEATDGASIIIGIIAAPIVAFLEYASFHVIALLIGSLASIVLNTKITANIALYNSKKNMSDVPQQNSNNSPPPSIKSTKNSNDFSKIETCVQDKNHKKITKNSNVIVLEEQTNVFKTFCPNCKEDLSFMEYDESDFIEPQNCPFCNIKIVGFKNGNLYL